MFIMTDQTYSWVWVTLIVVNITGGLIALLSADVVKPLGAFARLGIFVTIIGLYAFILVPEQARVIPFCAVLFGTFAMVVNRWDGTLPGLARKPRP